MTVSKTWFSFGQGFRAPVKGFGVDPRQHSSLLLRDIYGCFCKPGCFLWVSLKEGPYYLGSILGGP